MPYEKTGVKPVATDEQQAVQNVDWQKAVNIIFLP